MPNLRVFSSCDLKQIGFKRKQKGKECNPELLCETKGIIYAPNNYRKGSRILTVIHAIAQYDYL